MKLETLPQLQGIIVEALHEAGIAEELWADVEIWVDLVQPSGWTEEGRDYFYLSLQLARRPFAPQEEHDRREVLNERLQELVPREVLSLPKEAYLELGYRSLQRALEMEPLI